MGTAPRAALHNRARTISTCTKQNKEPIIQRLRRGNPIALLCAPKDSHAYMRGSGARCAKSKFSLHNIFFPSRAHSVWQITIYVARRRPYLPGWRDQLFMFLPGFLLLLVPAVHCWQTRASIFTFAQKESAHLFFLPGVCAAPCREQSIRACE
jgi:hypothetical protein